MLFVAKWMLAVPFPSAPTAQALQQILRQSLQSLKLQPQAEEGPADDLEREANVAAADSEQPDQSRSQRVAALA